ncbi:hypothetical protein, partial [Novipirellula herctigrandis]|uniref:hypothetical protein n=1 Tax=Novipirellula herctigrandis TaxID=2527986 RepID=UPI003AF3CF95
KSSEITRGTVTTYEIRKPRSGAVQLVPVVDALNSTIKQTNSTGKFDSGFAIGEMNIRCQSS